MIRPPRLKMRDAVAVVAPAGPVPREGFARGEAVLARHYDVVYTDRVFDRRGFLAGDDAARLAELRRAIADPQIRAVVCARGGYGIMRLLPGLDPALLLNDPKPIVGFSDITALHAWAAHAGVASVHGPVVTQLGTLEEDDAASLFALLESPSPPPPLSGLTVLAHGRGEGRLAGGNLEMVTSLVGTPWAFQLDGAVLLLEEIGERPYRIDRALTQLLLSGAFDRVAGVVLGDFVRCADTDDAAPSAIDVIGERLAPLGIPVVSGAPIGHGTRNRAVPHGALVRLEGPTLTFLESAVS